MNREADLGEVCVLHTQRARSSVKPSPPAQTAQSPALTKDTCQYHSEEREQAEDRFDSG